MAASTRSSGQFSAPAPMGDFAGFASLAFLVLGVMGVVAAFGVSATIGWIFAAASVVSFVLIMAAERSGSALLVGLYVIACAWAALAGNVVFRWHWLAFTPAAWVWSAIMFAGFLASLRTLLAAWAKLLNLLLAAAAIVATAALPAPAGGEGRGDTSDEWTVRVTVRDEHAEALAGAKVACATTMKWAPRVAPQVAAQVTGHDGRIADWKFKEDKRMKVVVCTAWKDANGGNAGYPAAIEVLPSLAGGEFDVEFELVENPHPDTAFVVIEPVGDLRSSSLLHFELLADGEVIAKEWWEKLQGSGFTVPASSVGRQLAIRWRYIGDEPVVVPLDSVSLGDRAIVRIQIPRS